MPQTNIQKIVSILAPWIRMEGKLSSAQKTIVWVNYALQILMIFMCLLTSLIEQKIYLAEQISDRSIPIALCIVRIILAVGYIVFRKQILISGFRLSIILSFYLNRTPYMIIPLVFQILAELYQTLIKQKRNLNFDSRLECRYYLLKIVVIYLTVISVFLVDHSQISRVPNFIFVISLVYFVLASVDPIYSYRTKTTLKVLAGIPLIMSVYFLFQPLVPVFNEVTLINHCMLSSVIVFCGITFSFSLKTVFRSQIIFKHFTNLQIRDKLKYIWDLIYFLEIGALSELHFFIKVHRSMCLNPNCQLNQSVQNQIKIDKLKKAISIYLNKVLQKFSTQNEQIRLIFLFYRCEDQPKILYLLREDQLYQKIQQIRIQNNLQQYKDASIEYEQMMQTQLQVFQKVKFYLNNYDYLLSYLQKQKLRLDVMQNISEQLIKLKKYFLSFAPLINQKYDSSKQDQKKILTQRKGEYEQVNQIINSVPKITSKTSQMINFMRINYFNLPSIEAAECSQKNVEYINSDHEQKPIIIISAESYNLGKILNWNTATQKFLNYNSYELKQLNVSDIVPEDVTKFHQQIWHKASLAMQLSQCEKQLEAFIFCFTKTLYAQVCSLKVKTNSSISGNKWIAYFSPKFQRQSVIIVDKNGIIIGINKNAGYFGINLNISGNELDADLLKNLLQNKQKIKVYQNSQIGSGFKISKDSLWSINCKTPTFKQMIPYYIILVQPMQKVSKSFKQVPQLQNQQIISNFQFNFNPYQLKFTNQKLEEEVKQITIHNTWMQHLGIQQEMKNKKNNNLLYSQNINEMVYLNGTLQFKQNYEQVTQFQTHPLYVNGNFESASQSSQMIKKQTLVQNLKKINEKYPTSMYVSLVGLIILFCVSMGVWIGVLVCTNQIYDLQKQQQNIQIYTYTRKSLVYDIGSLAIYLEQNANSQSSWHHFQLKNSTFQSYFVQIQYTNGLINQLNREITLFADTNYLINGSYTTLSKTIQQLSILASFQGTTTFNLSQYISIILNSVKTLEADIQSDIASYYQQRLRANTNISFYLNVSGLAIFSLGVILLYFLIRKIQHEKYLLYKTVCFLSQEQIFRVQKNLQINKQKVKANEIDQINLFDYSVPVISQSLFRVKKLDQCILQTKKILFYPLAICMMILLGSYFITSESRIEQRNKISLVDPFIKISNEQRLIFSETFMIMMTKVQIQKISSKIQQSIIKFEDYKLQIIQSLIEKPFSDKFLQFYHQIWFNSCTFLQVQSQCQQLFKGFINENIDYSFIYVITYVNKILISEQYLDKAGMSNLTLVSEVTSSIESDSQKVVFLLFKFLTRLKTLFNSSIQDELNLLTQDSKSRILTDFLIFAVFLIGLFGLLLLLVYKLRNLTIRTLQIILCIVPFDILCRNKHFVGWYKQKFSNVY